MDNITICAIIKAKPGKEALLKDELLRVVGPSKSETGCIEYTLHESMEEKDTFVFYETWENEEAVKYHIESAHYKQYRERIALHLETREVFRLRKI